MRYALITVSVASALLSTGCLFGGGGGGGSSGLFSSLGEFFGGGSTSSSSNSDILALSTGGGTEGATQQIADLPADGGTGGTDVPDVATLHNPEPGSLALFGMGLAGAGFLRRRRRARRVS